MALRSIDKSEGGKRNVTSAADVRERIREASSARTPLRIVGGGRWLDAGWPVRAENFLTLTSLTGIVDYNPGDLTLTALGGTPLDEIVRAIALERQWLAIDPMGDPVGTIGATISTASAGPLANAFGLPRDNVLGVEAVTGTGDIVRAGGRVVKNVAGFDLTRLFTGSWGTLGVITYVTLRLRGIPEADETYAVPVDDLASVERMRLALRGASLAPWCVEYVNPALSSLINTLGGYVGTVLVRVAGNGDAVSAQRQLLERIGDMTQVSTSTWTALRASEPTAGAVARLSRKSSEIVDTLSFAGRACASCDGSLIHASLGRGVVRCIVPTGFSQFVQVANAFAGTCIFERLPAELWRAVASMTNDHLSVRLRQQFDPNKILNPGIMGEAA